MSGSFAANGMGDANAKMVAMPMSGGMGAGGGGGAQTGQIRKEFPESWIWTSSVAKYVFILIYNLHCWRSLLF